VVRDTMQKIMGSTRSDHQLAVFGKVVTIVIGVLGIVVAWDDQRKIFDFVLYAWSGLGAAFGPTLLCVLYYKRTTWAGVIAGMIAGFATSIVWVEVFKAQTYDLYEAIPGFIAGFLATLAVSALTREAPRAGDSG
jgi:sodium/proline symporter